MYVYIYIYRERERGRDVYIMYNNYIFLANLVRIGLRGWQRFDVGVFGETSPAHESLMWYLFICRLHSQS